MLSFLFSLYTYANYELDKVAPEGQPALEEPHRDHVIGQRDNVIVVLERVGVRQSYGKDGHVLVTDEVGEHRWQLRQSCNTPHSKENSPTTTLTR
jgi:hypothetical protein